MARIAGIELQDNQRIDYSLTRVKGIGWTLSKKILDEVKVPSNKRIKELSSEEISKISTKLEDFTVEGDLIGSVKENIIRLQRIGSYRGLRHTKGLPVHGQRTRTNARTKRGKRKTVGAFKKEVLTKMTTAQTSGGGKEAAAKPASK